MTKFCVITKVGAYKNGIRGILSDDFFVSIPEAKRPDEDDDTDKVVLDGIPDRFIPEGADDTNKLTPIKVPVFEEGEILVCDDAGIEVGKERKPWKWDVEYEMFDDVEEAVKKAVGGA